MVWERERIDGEDGDDDKEEVIPAQVRNHSGDVPCSVAASPVCGVSIGEICRMKLILGRQLSGKKRTLISNYG